MAIKNDNQYYVTCAQHDLLESALKDVKKDPEKYPPVVFRAMVAGIESQMAELKAEIEEYLEED